MHAGLRHCCLTTPKTGLLARQGGPNIFTAQTLVPFSTVVKTHIIFLSSMEASIRVHFINTKNTAKSTNCDQTKIGAHNS